MTGLRERKKVRVRETILAAAQDLFLRHGYDGATVAEIADAADVSKATFFTYFSSKEDLVFDDLARAQAELERVLSERPRGVPALQTFRTFLLQRVSSGVSEEAARARRRIVANSDQLAGPNRARIGRLGDVVGAAVATDLGESPDGLRPRLVSSAVSAAMLSIAAFRAARGTTVTAPDDVTEVIDLMIAFLHGGLDAISDETLMRKIL